MTENENNAVVVRGQTPSAAPTAPNITGVGGRLPEVLEVCNAIAAAGEMIPAAYRGKPGAVLLAKMWADKHDVDLFTAIQNIDVIDGKPWVKTAMRVELAVDRGFEFRVLETTREVCTVQVFQRGHSPGRPITPKPVGDPITARFDDRPRQLETKNRKPTPWALHPDDMLFAEACRKADRRYVKTAAGMLDAEQEYDDLDAAGDPLATIETIIDATDAPQDVAPGPVPEDQAPDPAGAARADSARETDDPGTTEPVVTVAELQEARKAAKLTLSQVFAWLNDGEDDIEHIGTLPELVADQPLARWVLAQIQAGAVTKELSQ